MVGESARQTLSGRAPEKNPKNWREKQKRFRLKGTGNVGHHKQWKSRDDRSNHHQRSFPSAGPRLGLSKIEKKHKRQEKRDNKRFEFLNKVVKRFKGKKRGERAERKLKMMKK